MHTHSQTLIHTHTHTFTHIHTHSHTLTHTHTHSHTFTHIHTHSHTFIHTHTHSHTTLLDAQVWGLLCSRERGHGGKDTDEKRESRQQRTQADLKASLKAS